MLQYAADVGTLLFALITFLVWVPMTVAAYEAVTGSRDRAGLVLHRDDPRLSYHVPYAA